MSARAIDAPRSPLILILDAINVDTEVRSAMRRKSSANKSAPSDKDVWGGVTSGRGIYTDADDDDGDGKSPNSAATQGDAKMTRRPPLLTTRGGEWQITNSPTSLRKPLGMGVGGG